MIRGSLEHDSSPFAAMNFSALVLAAVAAGDTAMRAAAAAAMNASREKKFAIVCHSEQ